MVKNSGTYVLKASGAFTDSCKAYEIVANSK